MPIKISQPSKRKYSFATGFLLGVFLTLFMFILYLYVFNNPSFIYQTGLYRIFGLSPYVAGKILVTVDSTNYDEAVSLFLENAEPARLVQYSSNGSYNQKGTDIVFEVTVPAGQEEKWIQLYKTNQYVKNADYEYQKIN